MSRPELTKGLAMHVNGGSHHSLLVEEVFADGERTGITIIKRTDGRPDYRIQAHEIHAGEEVLDLLDPDARLGWLDWIHEHLPQRGEEPPCPD